jgi:hypothetical protein
MRRQSRIAFLLATTLHSLIVRRIITNNCAACGVFGWIEAIGYRNETSAL